MASRALFILVPRLLGHYRHSDPLDLTLDHHLHRCCLRSRSHDPPRLPQPLITAAPASNQTQAPVLPLTLLFLLPLPPSPPAVAPIHAPQLATGDRGGAELTGPTSS